MKESIIYLVFLNEIVVAILKVGEEAGFYFRYVESGL